jgi:hypothetical protein
MAIHTVGNDLPGPLAQLGSAATCCASCFSILDTYLLFHAPIGESRRRDKQDHGQIGIPQICKQSKTIRAFWQDTCNPAGLSRKQNFVNLLRALCRLRPTRSVPNSMRGEVAVNQAEAMPAKPQGFHFAGGWSLPPSS